MSRAYRYVESVANLTKASIRVLNVYSEHLDDQALRAAAVELGVEDRAPETVSRLAMRDSVVVGRAAAGSHLPLPLQGNPCPALISRQGKRGTMGLRRWQATPYRPDVEPRAPERSTRCIYSSARRVDDATPSAVQARPANGDARAVAKGSLSSIATCHASWWMMCGRHRAPPSSPCGAASCQALGLPARQQFTEQLSARCRPRGFIWFQPVPRRAPMSWAAPSVCCQVFPSAWPEPWRLWITLRSSVVQNKE